MITRCLLTRTFFYMECTYRVMKMFLKVQQHFEYWLTKKRNIHFEMMFFMCAMLNMLQTSHAVRLSVERGHSVFSSRHNGQWPPTLKDFYTRFYPLHFCPIYQFLRKSQNFPLQCWALNEGTTGTIFTMPLVWRGPWLEIEPGTFHTGCQHSTTRLSRRNLSNEAL